MRIIIQAVREIAPDMPIQIYLNDLPECRFDVTINTVTKGLQLDTLLKNVYVSAVGKDFTTQVFPKRLIDIGFSTLTVMIISCPPAPIVDNIFFVAQEVSPSHKEAKLWIEGIKKHFELFLQMRSKELKPHGVMFISTMVVNEPELKPY